MCAGITGLISYSGRAIGTSVGSSLIMGRSGTRFAYLVFGILSGSTSIIYFFLYHSLLKKIERKRLKTKGVVQKFKKFEKKTKLLLFIDSKEVAGDGITNAAADIPITEMLQSNSQTAECNHK